MTICFFPGSFDPFTNGHLQVVKKAAIIFDYVFIGIGVNSGKNRRYKRNIMEGAIKEVLKREHLDNVTIICYDDLTVDAAARCNATFLVRGLRNGIDYGEEEAIAATNEEVSGLDTIYIRSGALGFISSTAVYELLNHGKDVSKYVPEEVLKVL